MVNQTMYRNKHASYRKWRLLLIVLFLMVLPLIGAAESIDVTSDGSSYLGNTIAKMMSSADGGACVYNIQIDREAHTATLSYNVTEPTGIMLRICNDYNNKDGSDKMELYCFGPYVLEPGQSEIVVQLPALPASTDLPEYFVVEAEPVGSTDTADIYSEYSYTESLQKLNSASPEDYPDGYFVPVTAAADTASLQAEGIETDTRGATEGFIVYNEDLLLLNSDTQLLSSDDNNDLSMVLAEVPE